MDFKKWLKNEEMTSTSCVAGVPMRWGAMQTRVAPEPLILEKGKKRKKY